MDKLLLCVENDKTFACNSCDFYNYIKALVLSKLALFKKCVLLYKTVMPKRTYQPKKRQRAKEHGFFKRMKTKAGKLVLKRRRQKGRSKLSA